MAKHTYSRKQNKILVVITIIIALMMLMGSLAFLAHGQTIDASTSINAGTIQDQINAKNQQLAAINQQIQSAKMTLQQTQSQRVTLQQQVNVINGNIKTLNLGIQADQISAQQAALMIQQLAGDIQDINDSIDVKQQAIGSLLQEIAAQDAANQVPLAVLLSKGTLADSVFEAQSVRNLQDKLTQNINDLQGLQTRYHTKQDATTAAREAALADANDLQNKKAIVQDQQTAKQALLASTKNQEGLFQKQLADLLKQQQQIASDLEALDAISRSKINPSTLPAAQAGTLLVPIAGDNESDITQGYGATAFAKNGYAGHWHNGIDFGASIGTPLLAAANGTVAAVGNNDLYCPRGAYGKFVVINFTNNLSGLYGHLSRPIVKVGDTVTRGQIIGYSGQTGYALGAHLHFTIYATPTFYLANSRTCGPLPVGGDLNPIPYLF